MVERETAWADSGHLRVAIPPGRGRDGDRIAVINALASPPGRPLAKDGEIIGTR